VRKPRPWSGWDTDGVYLSQKVTGGAERSVQGMEIHLLERGSIQEVNKKENFAQNERTGGKISSLGKEKNLGK